MRAPEPNHWSTVHGELVFFAADDDARSSSQIPRRTHGALVLRLPSQPQISGASRSATVIFGLGRGVSGPMESALTNVWTRALLTHASRLSFLHPSLPRVSVFLKNPLSDKVALASTAVSESLKWVRDAGRLRAPLTKGQIA